MHKFVCSQSLLLLLFFFFLFQATRSMVCPFVCGIMGVWLSSLACAPALYHAMLRYALLCFAMLRYAMPCHVVLVCVHATHSHMQSCVCNWIHVTGRFKCSIKAFQCHKLLFVEAAQPQDLTLSLQHTHVASMSLLYAYVYSRCTRVWNL